MELLPQLRYSGGVTKIMGKRTDSCLTKDGWNAYMKMKFNGGNQNGWSFPVHRKSVIKDAVMIYVPKTIVSACCEKVAAMDLNPNLSYLRSEQNGSDLF